MSEPSPPGDPVPFASMPTPHAGTMAIRPTVSAVSTAAALREGALGEVRKAVVGQDEPLELMLCALFAGGHVLLEGVPGVAKTLLVRALAASARRCASGASSSRPT